jgi:hypothetical protein
MAPSKHLKDSVRLCFQEPIKGKMPIGQVDSEIINEIIIFLGKIGPISDEFRAVIEQWKNNSDEDILNAAMDINNKIKRSIDTDLAKELLEDMMFEEDGPKKARTYFIELQDQLFNARYLTDIKKDVIFDTVRGELDYVIIINGENGDGTKATGYSTSIIKYYDEDHRDAEYELLKSKMSKAKIQIL